MGNQTAPDMLIQSVSQSVSAFMSTMGDTTIKVRKCSLVSAISLRDKEFYSVFQLIVSVFMACNFPVVFSESRRQRSDR